jgi:hypothetical protein
MPDKLPTFSINDFFTDSINFVNSFTDNPSPNYEIDSVQKDEVIDVNTNAEPSVDQQI